MSAAADGPRFAQPDQAQQPRMAERDPDAAARVPGPLGTGGETVEAVAAQQRKDAELDAARPTMIDGPDAANSPAPRAREHAGSYGGMAGTPRTSSDQREPLEASGAAPADAHGRGGDTLDSTGRGGHAALAGPDAVRADAARTGGSRTGAAGAPGSDSARADAAQATPPHADPRDARDAQRAERGSSGDQPINPS